MNKYHCGGDAQRICNVLNASDRNYFYRTALYATDIYSGIGPVVDEYVIECYNSNDKFVGFYPLKEAMPFAA